MEFTGCNQRNAMFSTLPPNNFNAPRAQCCHCQAPLIGLLTGLPGQLVQALGWTSSADHWEMLKRHQQLKKGPPSDQQKPKVCRLLVAFEPKRSRTLHLSGPFWPTTSSTKFAPGHNDSHRRFRVLSTQMGLGSFGISWDQWGWLLRVVGASTILGIHRWVVKIMPKY